MSFVSRGSLSLLAAVSLAVVLAAGCGKSAPPPQPPAPAPQVDPIHGHLLHPQPKLPTLKVWLGDQELTAEVATKPVEIATGMMYRTNLLENEGMLFAFPSAAPRSFYMRNCVIPLSAAYIDPEGVILEIVELRPGDEIGVLSRSNNIQYVLEVNLGWFERHNIKEGAAVRTERGSLRETFFRR